MPDLELTLVIRIDCFLDDLPLVIEAVEEAADGILVEYDWVEI